MNWTQKEWIGVAMVAVAAVWVGLSILHITKPWRRHDCPRCNVKMPRWSGVDISKFVFEKTGEYFNPLFCHGRKCAKCSWVRFTVTKQLLGTWN